MGVLFISTSFREHASFRAILNANRPFGKLGQICEAWYSKTRCEERPPGPGGGGGGRVRIRKLRRIWRNFAITMITVVQFNGGAQEVCCLGDKNFSAQT